MAATLRESMTSVGVFGASFSTNLSWHAQTFTTTAAYNIEYIKVYLLKNTSVSPDKNLVFSIKATSASKPTGVDLTSGSISTSSINSITKEWYTITFSTPVSLSNATLYAIVGRLDDTPISGSISWYRNDSDTYAGGAWNNSTDGGSTWAIQARDQGFETWGSDIGYTKTINGISTYSFINGVSKTNIKKINDIG